jgi:hypothetical protein
MKPLSFNFLYTRREIDKTTLIAVPHLTVPVDLSDKTTLIAVPHLTVPVDLSDKTTLIAVPHLTVTVDIDCCTSSNCSSRLVR